jgi:hypothetical protein
MTFPSFAQRAANYIESRKIWVKAGKPMRSLETIKLIYNTHCKECEHYKSTGYACDICGCYINEGENWNKIAWATTRCPDSPPKWLEEEPYREKEKDTLNTIDAIPKEEMPPPPPPKPPGRGCGCGH